MYCKLGLVFVKKVFNNHRATCVRLCVGFARKQGRVVKHGAALGSSTSSRMLCNPAVWFVIHLMRVVFEAPASRSPASGKWTLLELDFPSIQEDLQTRVRRSFTTVVKLVSIRSHYS